MITDAEAVLVVDWLKNDPEAVFGPGLLSANADDPRAQVLIGAAECVLKDRNAAYGNPEDNFANIAGGWQWYLDLIEGRKLNNVDVAALMGLMKIARLATNPGHKDSWTDLAGYAACGYRCAVA